MICLTILCYGPFKRKLFCDCCCYNCRYRHYHLSYDWSLPVVTMLLLCTQPFSADYGFPSVVTAAAVCSWSGAWPISITCGPFRCIVVVAAYVVIIANYHIQSFWFYQVWMTNFCFASYLIFNDSFPSDSNFSPLLL